MDPELGDAAVGVGVVVDVGRLPRGAARQRLDLPELLIREVGLLARQLAAVGALGLEVFDDLLNDRRHGPRGGVVHVAVPGVQDLADRRGVITVPHEVLRHGDGV
ncbi:MAG: hypothetical protein ACYTGQ_12315, partial [Planctomycetota bacterium]